MGLAWNPLGLAGIVAGGLALGMAIIVLRASAAPGANRRLALVLAVEGLAAITGTGIVYLVDGRAVALGVQLFATAASLLLPSLYLLLIATLPARRTGPARGRILVWTAALLALALEAALVVRPSWFVADVAPTWYARWEAVPGPFAWLPAALLLVVSIYGLYAALAARRVAPPATIRRMRASAYAWAFGARDVMLVIVVLSILIGPTLAPSRTWDLVPVLGFPLALLVYVPTLAYVILRTQLFDIEIRVKGSVQRGVVFAMFIIAYAMVSQLAALLVPGRAATAIGVAAAGALAFVILPLERSAARVADVLMPRVHDGERYLAERKLEVYRAAIEESEETPQGAASLQELRARLGVSEAEHVLLTELVARPRATAPLLAARYATLRTLGSGGGGSTVLARDELLGREVALKRVRGGAREALAEARSLALMHDPHVVTVHDAVRDGGDVLIVMEHVAGGSLKERLARGALSDEEFARVARGILRGLDAMHAVGIVHRDVKPANVLLTQRGEPKLADFGLAGALSRGAGATLRYASPEQRQGGPASASSDLWSAGAALREAAPAALDATLAPWFERVMATQPADRFASAREALEALTLALTPPRMPAASDPRR